MIGSGVSWATHGLVGFLLGDAALAAASFSSTVGLGSIIVGMLVVILFGIFSLRDRRNSGWKDLYEQEREKNQNLLEEKEQERADRHAVKDELAATKALLAIEHAKPDLQQILEKQRELWTESTKPLVASLERITASQEQMLELLTETTKGRAT